MNQSIRSDLVHEVEKADCLYGDFTSTHEGYGVLAEEVSELLEAIRSNDRSSVYREAVQVAAVAMRIACSLQNSSTRQRSGMT